MEVFTCSTFCKSLDPNGALDSALLDPALLAPVSPDFLECCTAGLMGFWEGFMDRICLGAFGDSKA